MKTTHAGSPLMILTTVCIAQFMAPFMLTSVGVALPSLGRDLGASAMQLGLVEQLYVLSLAMTMLTFGRLGDIAGQRRIFMAGLFGFTLMTFLLGFADRIQTVMALRFVQGIGAAWRWWPRPILRSAVRARSASSQPLPMRDFPSVLSSAAT
jgi:MFS family permease